MFLGLYSIGETQIISLTGAFRPGRMFKPSHMRTHTKHSVREPHRVIQMYLQSGLQKNSYRVPRWSMRSSYLCFSEGGIPLSRCLLNWWNPWIHYTSEVSGHAWFFDCILAFFRRVQDMDSILRCCQGFHHIEVLGAATIAQFNMTWSFFSFVRPYIKNLDLPLFLFLKRPVTTLFPRIHISSYFVIS